jgi:hypothetical protein
MMLRKLLLMLVFFTVTCGYAQKKKSIIDRLQAKTTIYSDYTLFETKNFSIQIPKTWETFVEPRIKEQIRHAPKGNEHEFLWVVVLPSKDPSKSIQEAVQRNLSNSVYSVKYDKSNQRLTTGKDALGTYARTQFDLSSEKDELSVIHYYYALEGNYLLVRMTYKKGYGMQNVMESIKKSIQLK